MTAADRPLRDLLRRDAASRSSGRFCADCVNTGEPCPDHRQDPAADAETSP